MPQRNLYQVIMAPGLAVLAMAIPAQRSVWVRPDCPADAVSAVITVARKTALEPLQRTSRGPARSAPLPQISGRPGPA